MGFPRAIWIAPGTWLPGIFFGVFFLLVAVAFNQFVWCFWRDFWVWWLLSIFAVFLFGYFLDFLGWLKGRFNGSVAEVFLSAWSYFSSGVCS